MELKKKNLLILVCVEMHSLCQRVLRVSNMDLDITNKFAIGIFLPLEKKWSLKFLSSSRVIFRVSSLDAP